MNKSKFQDVKVGDIVILLQTVNYTVLSSKCFYVPKKVVRVTKTQFVTENGSRYGKDGFGIGPNRFKRVFKTGDTDFTGHVVSDESKEMSEFVEKLKIYKRMISMAKELISENTINLSLDDLNSIESKIIDIKNLTNKD